MHRGNMLACFIAAVVLLLCTQPSAAQKLSGNSTGSGMSCIPDPYSLGLGQGCEANEGCCPQTNTCVKKGSCEEFVKICPPPTCGKDSSFADVECPTDVTKVFKSPKGLKCRASSDTMCYSNGTAIVVACKNGAGATASSALVAILVALAAVLMM